VASVETGDMAAVCLTTEATKDWPHGGEQNVLYHSPDGSTDHNP